MDGPSESPNLVTRGPRRFWRRWVRRCTQCVSRPPSRGDPQVILDSPKQGQKAHGCSAFPDVQDSIEELLDYFKNTLWDKNYLIVLGFLTFHISFVDIWDMLSLIMKRFPSFKPDCQEDHKDKRTISLLLTLWMDRMTEEFCLSPIAMTVLTQLKDYVAINMLDSHLADRVKVLQSVLYEQQYETEYEEACGSSELQAQEDILEIEDFGSTGDLGPTEDPVIPIKKQGAKYVIN